MLISDIQKQVVDECTAVLLRERMSVKGEARQYDVKPLFTGNKKGWSLLDLTTANALCTCYNALTTEENRQKWDKISVFRLIDVAWKCLS